jgi:hypothetical protein
VRLRRKLWPQSYANVIPPFVASEIVEVVRKTEAGFIFLHMTDTAPLAGALRAQLGPDIRITLLSHGTESVDYLHKLRAREEIAEVIKAPRCRRGELARQLCEECIQRQYIDHVFCLSPCETEVERWLGAKAVTWLPRTVPGKPLSWQPRDGRIGFVGSICHEPNIEGLLKFAKALESMSPDGLSLRVVGGPEEVGQMLKRRFRFLEYLGPLPDPELEREAATWNCVVNPIFCYPRGCSTKLAVALGWQIPVLTTPGGCRGYTWSAGKLPVADTPEGLARLAISMTNRETAAAARREVQQVAESSPSVDQVGGIIRGALFPGRNGMPVLNSWLSRV